jgi:hypothetical protein
MKNWKKVVAAAAVLSVTTSAMAAQLTAYFELDNLDAITSADAGYVVYPKNYTLPNPASCANTGKAEVYQSATAADKELMNKTLLSAFMAGRKVRLSLSSSTCSSNNYPAYHMVRVDAAQ